MSYFITTDATCDLATTDLIAENVKIIPMTYTIGEMEYGVDKNLTSKEFYDKVRNGAMPTTSLITAYTATEFFRPILQAGNDILHICFSSGLSSTYQSLISAVDEMKTEFPDRKIYLIDSRSATLGEGLLVYYASKARDNGMSIEDNFNYTSELVTRMCHYFTPDDLFHLYRGGRVSKGAAVMGSLLQIKPVLYCNIEGKLIPIEKVKGRKKALLSLVAYMQKHISSVEENELVAISHADCIEDAEFVKAKVIEKTGVKNVIITNIGPVIGSHAGPGTVALIFLGDTRIEPNDETLKQ